MNPNDPLVKYLIEQQSRTARDYFHHVVSAPDPERSMILVAHAVVERLLGEMIATRLSNPAIWLDKSNFTSRTNLARAMGMIGDFELNLCRVLNKVRNSAAHEALQPLSAKLQDELVRLARRGDEESPDGLAGALQEIVRLIVAPWLYARVGQERGPFLEKHKERWIALMTQRLRTSEDPEGSMADPAQFQRLGAEVTSQLVEELRSRDA